MSRVGKVTARRMLESKQSIPHFYVSVTVDMTEAVHFRGAYNARPGIADGERLSFTDLIVRAAALAMKVHPRINSTVRDEDSLIIWDDINIGIAVATDAGLIVPVLEKVDALLLPAIIEQSRRVAAMARDGRQSAWIPARLTISNLGMYNVDNFVAIINPPEAAILAVSSVRKQLVVYDNGGFAPRDMMNMTLSMDHRIGDGVLAARFANEIRMLLEQPDLLR
jgi:pyruvate dehydrogenase E2 component (dihydrolipoamide acetyltransferase)